MYILSKLLPWFVLPLGVSLILLVWGLWRRQRVALWAGVAVLLVSSNPIVGVCLIRSAESWAQRRPIAEIPGADAIVVLSGGRIVAPGRERFSEWGDADRFFGGVALFRAHRAPLLVFTGAQQFPDLPSEGALLATEALARGVPVAQVAVTASVWNTADEAREVARLLHERRLVSPRVVLVTSAFHMVRARQAFERQGMSVEPFPVDFSISQGTSVTMRDFVPSIAALALAETAIREFYGRAFYWAFRR